MVVDHEREKREKNRFVRGVSDVVISVSASL